MAKRYKIIYEREGCIGAAACVAVASDFFKLDDDGKATLLTGEEKKDGTYEQKRDVTEVEPGIFVCYVDEDELERVKAAAESCPVLVIHVEDTETGERLL